MSDTLISFETAKLAKEKGFEGTCSHWTCIGAYNLKESREIRTYDAYDEYGNVVRLKTVSKIGSGQPHIALVPSQSLLQYWLREKHDIDIVITPDRNSRHRKIEKKYFITLWIYMINVNVQPFILKTDKKIDYYMNYENALEAGLIEALKLIK